MKTEKKLVTFRLSVDLVKAMREQAEREQRSVTRLVEYHMRQACLRKDENDKPDTGNVSNEENR